MATYNGERFLAAQLDSILAQDYPNIEIVVSDDQSSDTTIEILQAYQKVATDVSLHIYRNEKNLGYVKNFESAVSHCRGEFIAFCDQDDIWLPQKISSQLLTLQAAKAKAVYCDAALVDAIGSDLNAGLWDSILDQPPPTQLDYRAFYLANCVTGCTMMIDRQLLDQALPFIDGIPHDWWLAYHAAYNNELVYAAEKLIGYRQHGNNVFGVSSSVRKKRLAFYWRHKRRKWSLVYQLNRHVQGLLETRLRLSAMYRFELASDRGVSEELQYLKAWIDDRLASRDLAKYRELFNSNSPMFQLFTPSKYMTETLAQGIQRMIRRTVNSCAGTLILLVIGVSIIASVMSLV